MHIPNQKKQSSKLKKWVIALISLVAISLLAYSAYGYVTKSLWPFVEPVNKDPAPASVEYEGIKNINEVDYSGPSKEDLDSSQDGKKEATSTQSNETTQVNGKRLVSIGVTYAGVTSTNLEIRAFTPSVIEGNGTCKATLTKNSSTVTESSSAFVDTSTSQCNPIFISLDKFKQSGTWRLVLSYSSNTSQGSSEEIEVKI